jgi:hypothetical protein
MVLYSWTRHHKFLAWQFAVLPIGGNFSHDYPFSRAVPWHNDSQSTVCIALPQQTSKSRESQVEI